MPGKTNKNTAPPKLTLSLSLWQMQTLIFLFLPTAVNNLIFKKAAFVALSDTDEIPMKWDPLPDKHLAQRL